MKYENSVKSKKGVDIRNTPLADKQPALQAPGSKNINTRLQRGKGNPWRIGLQENGSAPHQLSIRAKQL